MFDAINVIFNLTNSEFSNITFGKFTTLEVPYLFLLSKGELNITRTNFTNITHNIV